MCRDYLSSAPGEAEAELAYFNRLGLVDAVFTEDSDILVFGARYVLRRYVPFILCFPMNL